MSLERINQVFHPERPVVKKGLLFGRTTEVAKTVAHLETVGGHVLLCGQRGIGKTSIARVAEALLREKHGSVVVAYVTCDQRISFDRIIGMIFAEAKLGNIAIDQVPPSFVAAALSEVEGFVLIDEAERLAHADRLLIAELMKCLSDHSAKFSVCVIGVARTALDLFHQHPSVQRCLNEIPIRGLQKRDIQALIEDGFAALEQKIRPDTVLDIVRLSRGFPAYAVAICHHLAQTVHTSQKSTASPTDLCDALEEYLRGNGAGAFAVLRRVLAVGERGAKRDLLLASSYIDDDEFTLEQISASAVQFTDGTREPTDAMLTDLCIDGPTKVFDIVVPGIYTFNNPRMSMIIQAHDFVQRNRSAG